MIKPIHNNLLIELIEEETITKQGLIIRNNQNNDIKIGIIIRVSDDIENKCFKDRTKVLFNINDANKVFYENKNYILIEDIKILGIIEGD